MCVCVCVRIVLYTSGLCLMKMLVILPQKHKGKALMLFLKLDSTKNNTVRILQVLSLSI